MVLVVLVIVFGDPGFVVSERRQSDLDTPAPRLSTIYRLLDWAT
jgi:hypothetical protein